MRNLLQEIFINAYIYLNDYDNSIPFSSWIFRVAHKEILSFSHQNKGVSANQTLKDDHFPCRAIINALQLTPEEEIKYASSDLQEAVNRLESKCRDVIVLKYMLEKTEKELSDILEIHEDVVTTLLSIAEKELKKLLEQIQ